MMFNWDGRISDNNSILAMKAALPFLDIPIGDVIDLEGLLRAVRGFCAKKEQKMIDMLLQFFMMKRVFSMMNAMNEAQNSASGMDGMLDILKSQMPKEQQEMFDMMSVMMSAMEMPAPSESEQETTANMESKAEPMTETDQSPTEQPEMPDIWTQIVNNIGRDNENDKE